MAITTPHVGLTYLEIGQKDKTTTINTNMALIDGYIGSLGYSGSSGPGYVGSVGFTGSAGYTGSVGYAGSKGYSGSVGFTGSSGFTGSQGNQGYTGSGYSGSSGGVGFTGSQGYSGSVGFTGSQGIGYTGSSGASSNPVTSFLFKEDFIASEGSNGVFDVGWALWYTVTLSPEDGVQNHPGLAFMQTPTSAGTYSITPFNNGNGQFYLGDVSSVTYILQSGFTNSASDVTVRVGLPQATASQGIYGNPPTNGVYFERLLTDSTWYAVTRAGGTQTRTNTSVTFDTNWKNLTFTVSGSTITFYINGSIVASNSTNVPTTSILSAGVQMITTTTTQRALNLDLIAVQGSVSR